MYCHLLDKDFQAPAKFVDNPFLQKASLEGIAIAIHESIKNVYYIKFWRKLADKDVHESHKRFNFVNNTCPYYLNEIFEFAPHCRIGTRNNFSKLKNPFRKTNMGQKAISYIGPSIWNSLPDSIKRANSLNTFKHNVKKHYLT